MKYETEGEKALKIIGYSLLVFVAWLFYMCGGSGDPLFHSIMHSLVEIVEHIR